MQSERPADGEYTAEVTLSGGSGRAGIQSPAELTVTDGSIQAKIIWSSGNYDYMEVDGTSYFPVNETGNSVFVIDISGLDQEIPVLAETTAMSQPHTIEYTLNFHSDTLQSASAPLLAIVLICSGAALLCAAAVSVWIAKRRKKHHENHS